MQQVCCTCWGDSRATAWSHPPPCTTHLSVWSLSWSSCVYHDIYWKSTLERELTGSSIRGPAYKNVFILGLFGSKKALELEDTFAPWGIWASVSSQTGVQSDSENDLYQPSNLKELLIWLYEHILLDNTLACWPQCRVKNVFLHPCRGSKLEGPPFEGPETSVQGPRGVGAPHLIDIKRMGE